MVNRKYLDGVISVCKFVIIRDCVSIPDIFSSYSNPNQAYTPNQKNGIYKLTGIKGTNMFSKRTKHINRVFIHESKAFGVLRTLARALLIGVNILKLHSGIPNTLFLFYFLFVLLVFFCGGNDLCAFYGFGKP